MAKRHTEWPEYFQELNLAKQLAGIEDQRLHLWFSLNHVPNVRDIDILIYHEHHGVFVIEVKGVPLQAIETFGYDRCRIEGREEGKGPRDQANKAAIALREVLNSRLRKSLFVTPTVCWPRIQRRIWNQTWDDEHVCGDFANRMIFEEDLSSDGDAFLERLAYIRTHPTIGGAIPPPFRHDPDLFNQLVAAIEVSAHQKPTPTDFDRLQSIERRIKTVTLMEVPPEDGRKILYEGAPGTGKTFRLLQVAYSHGLAGKRVLYLCFNKVLAADIKRLVRFSERLKVSDGSIEVRDVFDVLRLYADRKRLQDGTMDLNEWAEVIVEQMASEPLSVLKYDTVLIDEAQDLAAWVFDMIAVHTHTGSTICVAAGTGQEFYSSRGQWLKEFSQKAERKRLRRNFRNTEPVFKVAQTFYEAYGRDPSQIDRMLRRFKDRNIKGEASFPQCDRMEGSLPSLTALDCASVERLRGDPADYADALDSQMTKEYERIIRREIEGLTDQQRPIDLLILVPSAKCSQQRWAVEALQLIGTPFMDYTNDVKRRDIAQEDMVRLCTFHSSRGIEGHRVIVFGIESIEKLSAAVGVSPNNLGYVVLSRATIDLTVAHRSPFSSNTLNFMKEVLVQIRRSMNADRTVQSI